MGNIQYFLCQFKIAFGPVNRDYTPSFSEYYKLGSHSTCEFKENLNP